MNKKSKEINYFSDRLQRYYSKFSEEDNDTIQEIAPIILHGTFFFHKNKMKLAFIFN